jgi:hypothetical protein
VLSPHAVPLNNAALPLAASLRVWLQVIPIYGRGGNEDPRVKNKGDVDSVPHRPAGQRPAPVVRQGAHHNHNVMQPTLNMAPQPGLGLIPTLFGIPDTRCA